MEQLIEFIRNTDISANAMELVASIVLALWGAYTGSRWHKQIQESRFAAMYEAILVGARVTYTNVYKKLKQQLAEKGGVLTREDASRLSEYAYSEAVRAARDKAVKQALVDLTEETWDLLLNQAINELKRDGGKIQAPALPKAA